VKWGHSPFPGKRGRACQRGVTLVELVVTIVVIATAGSALLGTLSYLSGQGSNYILQAQAQSIADAYLSEITGKCFADCVPGPEANRQQFDDVTDYDGLDTPVATDEAGNVIGNFRVRVNLTAGGLAALPAASVWRVDVSVDYDNGAAVATGYRMNHP
jgi:prepilin-type N-terminal cleavage/methylation domain-containing protein